MTEFNNNCYKKFDNVTQLGGVFEKLKKPLLIINSEEGFGFGETGEGNKGLI